MSISFDDTTVDACDDTTSSTAAQNSTATGSEDFVDPRAAIAWPKLDRKLAREIAEIQEMDAKNGDERPWHMVPAKVQAKGFIPLTYAQKEKAYKLARARDFFYWYPRTDGVRNGYKFYY